MKTLPLFEKTSPKFELFFTDEVDKKYLEKHPALNAYSNLFDSNLLLPLLKNKPLKNELYIKETAIKVLLEKEKIQYKQDLNKLKNYTEKEIKAIIYSKKHSQENILQIYLNENYSPVAVYRKQPEKVAKIITVKKHPEKIAAIDFLLHIAHFSEDISKEKINEIMISKIDKIINSRKNLESILENAIKEFEVSDIIFTSLNTFYVISVKDKKIKIEVDKIKQYYTQECEDFSFDIENVPEDPISLKEEMKILKMHIKNIFKRNNTESLTKLPEEDKQDVIYTYIKYKKLKEKINLEKKAKKNEKQRATQ